MTHIDPFAPGDSPQHPSRWRHDPHATIELAEAMPSWIALTDEPVSPDNLNAAMIGEARWKEYDALLRDLGTDQQKELLDVIAPDGWPDDVMPTLAELRAKQAEAAAVAEAAGGGNPEGPEEPDDETGELLQVTPVDDPPPASATDLEAKLAALKAAGL